MLAPIRASESMNYELEQFLVAILKHTKEILSMSASTNAVIAKLQTDFATFQADFGTLATEVSTFVAAAKAFIASVQSGSTGTVLSAADAAALADLDTSIASLDQAAQAAKSSIGGVTIPAVPPPPSA